MFWFGEEFEQKKDVPLDFDGYLPMKGFTDDGSRYEIEFDSVFDGLYRVWLFTQDEEHEYVETVFKGSKNECKNYVYWELGVRG